MNNLNRNETLDEIYGSAWSRHEDGSEPSVADFLADHPGAPTSERLDVLLADQLFRWSRGLPKPVGEYLAEQPSLADEPEAILKLVQGEFLARLETGETPDPDSYARTFPRLAHEIRLQCEVDRWLTMPVPPGPLMSMATTADYGIGNDRSGPASASQVSADLDAPLVEADFELVRPLGSGGMGEVYEAIQKSLRKRVALKLIRREALDSPSRVRRFFVEARALARLRHPHIVGVHGIGRMSDGRYFLVMDLVEGGTTLAALLRQEPVPFDRAAGLVATVAEAIEHAHSRGVIHRDLKPSNVLLDAEGRPHVTDFGLAKVFDAVDADNSQTTADQILGTPHYMTPEQADRARGPITPRTDVFTLGGLLYALLTGRPPIQGDSLTAILTRVVSPEPVPSPRELRGDLPAALERICGTCLEKDAEKRYHSAGAVAAALRAWLANPEVEDTAGVTSEVPVLTSGSSQHPDVGRARSGWATDRSLKDSGRTPSPSRWTAKTALSAWPRRRMLVAASATVIILAVGMGVSLTRSFVRTANASRAAAEIAKRLDAGEIDRAATFVRNLEKADPALLTESSLIEVGQRLRAARELENDRVGRFKQAMMEANRELSISAEPKALKTARELARSHSERQSVAGLAQALKSAFEARNQSPAQTRLKTRPDLVVQPKETSPEVKSPEPPGQLKLVAAPPASAPSPLLPATDRDVDPGEAKDPVELDPSQDVALAGSPALPGDGALDKILAAPANFAGQTRVIDGLYKVGTRLTNLKGPDGRPVGWAIPVARNDGGLICTGEAKAVGRDVYLIVENGFAPFLEGIFRSLKMQNTVKPVHKCILTVKVPVLTERRGNFQVVEITGLEILGGFDLMKLINKQYDKAFTTVRIAPGNATVGYGNGPMWVERLGGEEKYVSLLRRKMRELQHRAITERKEALVGRFLQAEQGRVMAMSSAAQAQQARALSGLIGQNIAPVDR